MQQKLDIEDNYSKWAARSNNAKYGNALNLLKEGYADRSDARVGLSCTYPNACLEDRNCFRLLTAFIRISRE